MLEESFLLLVVLQKQVLVALLKSFLEPALRHLAVF
jgi:hypothetical protein